MPMSMSMLITPPTRINVVTHTSATHLRICTDRPPTVPWHTPWMHHPDWKWRPPRQGPKSSQNWWQGETAQRCSCLVTSTLDEAVGTCNIYINIPRIPHCTNPHRHAWMVAYLTCNNTRNDEWTFKHLIIIFIHVIFSGCTCLMVPSWLWLGIQQQQCQVSIEYLKRTTTTTTTATTAVSTHCWYKCSWSKPTLLHAEQERNYHHAPTIVQSKKQKLLYHHQQEVKSKRKI